METHEPCKHGINWPHECRECLEEVDPAVAVAWMEQEMAARYDPREVCLTHLEPEPCPTCAAYIAAGL